MNYEGDYIVSPPPRLEITALRCRDVQTVCDQSIPPAACLIVMLHHDDISPCLSLNLNAERRGRLFSSIHVKKTERT
jgi:hypothetical protein